MRRVVPSVSAPGTGDAAHSQPRKESVARMAVSGEARDEMACQHLEFYLERVLFVVCWGGRYNSDNCVRNDLLHG